MPILNLPPELSHAPIPVQETLPLDYGWHDDFIAKPAPGAVEIDATQSTLVTDMIDTEGQAHHFEYGPEITRKDADATMTRSSMHPGAKGNGVMVKMHFPFTVAKE